MCMYERVQGERRRVRTAQEKGKWQEMIDRRANWMIDGFSSSSIARCGDGGPF